MTSFLENKKIRKMEMLRYYSTQEMKQTLNYFLIQVDSSHTPLQKDTVP